MDVRLGEPELNLDRIQAALQTTASRGARLTVFPECAVTGYCFQSLDEARQYAEPIPGPSLERVAEVCRELQVFAVLGLLEDDGERVFNAAALVGPEGLGAVYRKVHLPYLGVDRFTTPGDRPFSVHAANDLRVGMSICYDGAFPEAARSMALDGADLLVLPTNWPPGAETTAEFVGNARALENGVYFAAVNRVGTERGFRFIGRSRICGVDGETLADAPAESESILYAQIDPAAARNKQRIRVPGLHVIDRFADRRPEMYGRITAGGPVRS